MKRTGLLLIAGLFLTMTNAMAHCEIPCGIYDDELRINLIKEHADTIEKSMVKIKELNAMKEDDANGALNQNQLTRWINNKEEHATEVQEIVYQYFMTQRIKPTNMDNEVAHQKYVKELLLLHQILVVAMKAKQTLDLDNALEIKALVSEFAASYFGKHEHEVLESKSSAVK